jgi:hypothetical protein
MKYFRTRLCKIIQKPIQFCLYQNIYVLENWMFSSCCFYLIVPDFELIKS